MSDCIDHGYVSTCGGYAQQHYKRKKGEPARLHRTTRLTGCRLWRASTEFLRQLFTKF